MNSNKILESWIIKVQLPILRTLLLCTSFLLKYNIFCIHSGFDKNELYKNVKIKTEKIKYKDYYDIHIIEPEKYNNNQIKGIIYTIHGGGFILTNSRLYLHAIEWWARYNYIIIAIDFPQSPDFKYPEAQLHILKSIKKMNSIYSNKNIKNILLGESAGANISLHLALCLNNKKCLDLFKETLIDLKLKYDNSYFDIKIDTVICHSGLFIKNNRSNKYTEKIINQVWKYYIPNKTILKCPAIVDELLNENLITNLPDILFCTSEKDFLYNDSIHLYQNIKKISSDKKINCKIELKIMKNCFHSFNAYSSLFSFTKGMYNKSSYCAEYQLNFLDKNDSFIILDRKKTYLTKIFNYYNDIIKLMFVILYLIPFTLTSYVPMFNLLLYKYKESNLIKT